MGTRSKAKDKKNTPRAAVGRLKGYKKGTRHFDKKAGRYVLGPRPVTFSDALRDIISGKVLVPFKKNIKDILGEPLPEEIIEGMKEFKRLKNRLRRVRQGRLVNA